MKVNDHWLHDVSAGEKIIISASGNIVTIIYNCLKLVDMNAHVDVFFYLDSINKDRYRNHIVAGVVYAVFAIRQ